MYGVEIFQVKHQMAYWYDHDSYRLWLVPGGEATDSFRCQG